MRCSLRTVVAALLLANPLAAQALTFDDFVWTFSGSASTSGFVTSDVMHVTGPANDGCFEENAVFTTTAPFAATVRARVEWQILDICHFDWPGHILNGQFVKLDVGDQNCWTDDAYELEFEVQAGDVFGLGVGSWDCLLGPGLADFVEFTFLPPAWIDAGGVLDPRLELEVAAPAGLQSFGVALASLGDIDGDGLAELVATGSSGFSQPNVISAFAGSDGTQLWSATGPAAYVPRLASPGDVDGDGVADVASSGVNDGSVVVLSGASGAAAWTVTGSVADGFGFGLASHADVDGDGVLDLAVGSLKEDSVPVRVLSGATGIESALILPGAGDQAFGRALGAPGDLDGDGVGDLMVGVGSGVLGPHHVSVVSGASGLELFELQPPGIGALWYLITLVGTGDWDGDGIPDLAVGAPRGESNPPFGGTGSVAIYSGATGGLMSWLHAPVDAADLGSALAGGLDVDGDGAPELAIGAPAVIDHSDNPPDGRVLLVGAPDALVMQEIRGAPPLHLGDGLAWLTGAGPPRLAVGVQGDGAGGQVRLYSDLAHAGGEPGLAMYGSMSSGLPWTVRLDHGLPGNLALFVAGLSAVSLPFKGGVFVPAADLLLPVVLDGAGVYEDTAPAPPGLTPAVTLWLQAWMPDAAGPQGWSATRAQKSPPP